MAGRARARRRAGAHPSVEHGVSSTLRRSCVAAPFMTDTTSFGRARLTFLIGSNSSTRWTDP